VHRVFLKALTLRGFKSFADRTHVTFGPGIRRTNALAARKAR